MSAMIERREAAMTSEEKLAEEIEAKMSPEDIERLQSCTDDKQAMEMLEEADVEIPIDMLDDVAGGDVGEIAKAAGQTAGKLLDNIGQILKNTEIPAVKPVEGPNPIADSMRI